MAEQAQKWVPALPYELVEATEYHGPYICTDFGTTVCDFYAMSNPDFASVRNGGVSRPIPFTDAAEHAAYMVNAANAYDDLLSGLKELRDCVLDAKGNFAVDDLKTQMALRTANTLLSAHEASAP